MAVKKTSASKTEPKATPKASVTKGATKTKAPKKAAPAPKAAAATKAPKKAAAAPKTKTPKVKKAPVKITEKQAEFLKTIHGTGEGGYPLVKKAEAKSLEALQEKKLVKKGAKNKETGHVHYHATKAGEKHISGGSTGTTPSA